MAFVGGPVLLLTVIVFLVTWLRVNRAQHLPEFILGNLWILPPARTEEEKTNIAVHACSEACQVQVTRQPEDICVEVLGFHELHQGGPHQQKPTASLDWEGACRERGNAATQGGQESNVTEDVCALNVAAEPEFNQNLKMGRQRAHM